MWNRIIGPTVLVVLCWLAFGGVVAMAMYWVGRFHSQVVAETGITIQAANSMSDTLWKTMTLVLTAKPPTVAETERRGFWTGEAVRPLPGSSRRDFLHAV